MTRRLHLNQRTALDRLWCHGPDLAERFPEHVRRGMVKAGFAEYSGVNGLLTMRLTYEGLFYMGATHDDLDYEANRRGDNPSDRGQLPGLRQS